LASLTVASSQFDRSRELSVREGAGGSLCSALYTDGRSVGITPTFGLPNGNFSLVPEVAH